ITRERCGSGSLRTWRALSAHQSRRSSVVCASSMHMIRASAASSRRTPAPLFVDLAMPLAVAGPAEPGHVERLAVILVMRLDAEGEATALAWLHLQLAIADGVANGYACGSLERVCLGARPVLVAMGTRFVGCLPVW